MSRKALVSTSTADAPLERVERILVLVADRLGPIPQRFIGTYWSRLGRMKLVAAQVRRFTSTEETA